MKNHYLAFDSEQQALALIPEDMIADHIGQLRELVYGIEVDVKVMGVKVGTQINPMPDNKPSGSRIKDARWHVNLLCDGALPAGLQPYAIATPKNPVRTWA